VAQHGRPDLPEPDPKRRKLDNGAPMAGDQPQARPVLPAAPAVTLPADQDTEMPLETEPEPVSALQPVIDMFGD